MRELEFEFPVTTLFASDTAIGSDIGSDEEGSGLPGGDPGEGGGESGSLDSTSSFLFALPDNAKASAAAAAACAETDD